MKRFSILRSQAALLMMARFFASSAVESARKGDTHNARHFAAMAASRYFEAQP